MSSIKGRACIHTVLHLQYEKLSNKMLKDVGMKALKVRVTNPVARVTVTLLHSGTHHPFCCIYTCTCFSIFWHCYSYNIQKMLLFSFLLLFYHNLGMVCMDQTCTLTRIACYNCVWLQTICTYVCLYDKILQYYVCEMFFVRVVVTCYIIMCLLCIVMTHFQF